VDTSHLLSAANALKSMTTAASSWHGASCWGVPGHSAGIGLGGRTVAWLAAPSVGRHVPSRNGGAARPRPARTIGRGSREYPPRDRIGRVEV